MVIINFDEVPESSGGSLYRTVPPGWYYARVRSVTERESAKGFIWDVFFECFERGKETPFLVKEAFFLYGGGLSRFKAFLKAIDKPHHGTLELVTDDIIGGELSFDIVQYFDEHWKENKMKGNGFNPFRHISDLDVLQGKDAKIDRKMDEKRAYREQEEHRSGAVPASARPPMGISISEDDIPF